MKDKDFEADSEPAYNIEQVTADFSFGLPEIPLSEVQVEVDWHEVNKRYLEYIRKLAAEQEK